MNKIQLSRTEAFAYRWVRLVREKCNNIDITSASKEEISFKNAIKTFSLGDFRLLYQVIEKVAKQNIEHLNEGESFSMTTDPNNHNMIDLCINAVLKTKEMDALTSINLSSGKPLVLSVDAISAKENMLSCSEMDICTSYDLRDPNNNAILIGQGMANKGCLTVVESSQGGFTSGSSTTDSAVMQFVVDRLLNYYPIINNRIDEVADLNIFEIGFQFGSSAKIQEFTNIYFSNGNNSFRLGTNDRLVLRSVINIEPIYEIIDWILQDHDVISNFTIQHQTLSMAFVVNQTEESIKRGIPLGTLLLTLDFAKYSKSQELLGNYATAIIKRYFKKLKHLKPFKEAAREHFRQLRNSMVDSLSDEVLKQHFGDPATLRYMLNEMDPATFARIIGEEDFSEGNIKI